MMRFDAAHPRPAANQNLTPFMQDLQRWEQESIVEFLERDPVYRESFLPVLERSQPQPIFRYADFTWTTKFLADAIETYRRRPYEIFREKFTEFELEMACICWTMKRHKMSPFRPSRSSKKRRF